MKNIPKRVHFIWLGSCLPQKYQDNILTWVKHNPDYQIILWIDSAALPLSPKQNLEEDPDVPSNAIPTMKKFCAENGIRFRDLADIATRIQIVAQFLAESFYNDWLNGEDKVYAFAADVLRLAILYVFGGIYADTDTICTRPLGELKNEIGLFLWGKINENRSEKFMDENFHYFLDNCFVASVVHNVVFLKALKAMRENYRRLILDPRSSSGARIEGADWDSYIYNSRRFRDCCNDYYITKNFAAVPFLMVVVDEIKSVYGKAKLNSILFETDQAIIHAPTRSWLAASNHRRRRKGVRTVDVGSRRELDEYLRHKQNDRMGVEISRLRLKI